MDQISNGIELFAPEVGCGASNVFSLLRHTDDMFSSAKLLALHESLDHQGSHHLSETRNFPLDASVLNI